MYWQNRFDREDPNAEIEATIKALIAEVGATSMKDMGKVMGALKTQYAGQMDFGKANGLIKSILG